MKLASKIAAFEGKKHQASIGDIREILKIIRKLIYDDAEILCELLKKPGKKK